MQERGSVPVFSEQKKGPDPGASHLCPLIPQPFLHHLHAPVLEAQPLHFLVQRRAVDAELVGRGGNRRNVVTIPVIGQIAAGLPIPVPSDLMDAEPAETVDVSADFAPHQGRDLFALRVKGHSMIDALINDGDVVVLRKQITCENGETVAVWLRDEKETTLKKFYLENDRVRLQPANVTMDPIYTSPDNVEIQGKLVTVVRSVL